MIRPFTLITMVLAMLSGAYLFAVKHRAQVLDDQLSAVANQTRLDEQRIRVLQAQWSLEIDPTRLSHLARQFTTLQPMQPVQLRSLADLAEVLPAPGSIAPGANPAAPMSDMPVVVSQVVVSQVAASQVSSSQLAASPVAGAAPAASSAPPAPLRLAKAESRPASPRPERVAAVKTHHPVSHSHIATDEFAENFAPPRPAHPVYAMGAQVMSVRAVASPAPLDNGSALAMGSDLAPPQPLAGGANN